MKWIIAILLLTLVLGFSYALHRQQQQDAAFEAERKELYNDIDLLRGDVESAQYEKDSLLTELDQMYTVVKYLKGLKFKNHEIIENNITDLADSDTDARLEYFNSWTIDPE